MEYRSRTEEICLISSYKITFNSEKQKLDRSHRVTANNTNYGINLNKEGIMEHKKLEKKKIKKSQKVTKLKRREGKNGLSKSSIY